MEIKTKLIEELTQLISDFDILDTELQASMPKTKAEMDSLYLPTSKTKKLKLAALNAKKLDTTYKINALVNVLVNYFNEDVTSLVPKKLTTDFDEFNKMIGEIEIKKGEIKYDSKFEDFVSKVEGIVKV